MPDGKKMMGAFFGNLITGIGKKKYQDHLRAQQESLGEKRANQGRADQLITTSLEKALDPDTPYMERIEWMKIYKGHTGVDLPTPSPGGVPQQGQTQGPGQQPTEVFDFLETASVPQQQEFLQASAERQKTLAGAESAQALAGERDAGAKSKEKYAKDGPSGIGADKLALDQLKTQFNQLNTEYDDLVKLIPRDIYGNPTIDAKDTRIQRLQKLDAERNRVYNKMYGGDKKTIEGF